MSDVLVFRDIIWFLRYLGWAYLFLLYIAHLTPRSLKKSTPVLCFLILLGITSGIQYGASITLLMDTIISILCWFSACFLLKKTNWRNALYGALAFAIINDLSKIISHDLIYEFILMQYLTDAPSLVCNFVFTILNIGIGSIGVFSFRNMIFKSDKRLFNPLQMVLILLPSIVYFYARNFQFILRSAIVDVQDNNYLFHLFFLLFLLGLSALLISILADNNLSTRLQQEELQHMQALIQKQHQEFIAQKSATEAISQKYHDLKNCLIGLKAENTVSSKEKARFIEEIEQIMKPIENNIETGNHFLNIILADKLKLCSEHQIRLTPYADGRDLSFIDGLDLCVIVGNALDNAIEAVQKLPLEKREIHMKISRNNNILILYFHNYHDDCLKPNDLGLFFTSKIDSHNHGYGLKGISQTVEKYNGSLAIDHTENEFIVNILIPIPNSTTSC